MFPGKLVEICKGAAIPSPTDRIEAMKGVSHKRSESDEYEMYTQELKDLEHKGKKGNVDASIRYADLILDYLDEETNKKIEQYISLYKVSRKQAIKDAFSNARTYPELEKLSFVPGTSPTQFKDYAKDVLLQWTEKCPSIYGPVNAWNICLVHRKSFIIAKQGNNYYLTCCDKQGCTEAHQITCRNCKDRMKLEVKSKTLHCDSCKFSIKYEPEMNVMEWKYQTKNYENDDEFIEDHISNLIEIAGFVHFTFRKRHISKKKVLTPTERLFNQYVRNEYEIMLLKLEREDRQLNREWAKLLRR